MPYSRSMITLSYRDRDSQPGELVAEAFVIDAEQCLYSLDGEGERKFVGQLEGECLNVYGYEWRRLCFDGKAGLEVRSPAGRERPCGEEGLSVGVVDVEPKLYDRGGAGRTLARIGSGEILICAPWSPMTQKPRRLSALGA